jgi:hypothetical protein
VVKIGRPPPPAAPKSSRGMRPVVPPKVAGQDSACRCGAGAFDATPLENLTQVFRSWGPRRSLGTELGLTAFRHLLQAFAGAGDPEALALAYTLSDSFR